jgi:hypothetical protein
VSNPSATIENNNANTKTLSESLGQPPERRLELGVVQRLRVRVDPLEDGEQFHVSMLHVQFGPRQLTGAY